MIIFKTVRYKNFLSTGNVFTEIQLNKNQTTLIIGENGAGKSTFLDAITFALFGKPFRNVNKPQLVNSINEKNCIVEIEFSIGNKEYRVVRGIKPNLFEIYCNNELVNQDAKSVDYQEQLEKFILKMNYKSFTQIVILGSTNFTPFMQLSAGDRRAVIEDLLDIQIFSSMSQIAKSKLSAAKEEASTLKVKIESVKSKIELHKKHLEELKRNNKELIDAKRVELEETSKTVEKTFSEITELEKQVTSLYEEITDKEATETRISKLNQYEFKIKNNLQKIKEDINFYSANSTCPTCDQTINNKDEKIHSCTEKQKELEKGITKLAQEVSSAIQRMDGIKEIQKKIEQVRQKIAACNSSNAMARKYQSKLLEDIKQLENKPSISEESKQQSNELLVELHEHIQNRKLAVEAVANYEIAAQLLKDGGIKSKIVKQYIPVINKLVNKYLSAMDFFVNFNMDEEFKESIKSRHRDDFSYDNFSEGEKKRIDLALLFTWRAVAKMKNSASTNLLVFDEVFDGSLDANGTEEFFKLISTVNDGTNIFVISHKGDVLADKFKNTIKFAKVKNFSQMV